MACQQCSARDRIHATQSSANIFSDAWRCEPQRAHALLEGQAHHTRPRLAVALNLIAVALRLGRALLLLLVHRVLPDLLVDLAVQILEVVVSNALLMYSH